MIKKKKGSSMAAADYIKHYTYDDYKLADDSWNERVIFLEKYEN